MGTFLTLGLALADEWDQIQRQIIVPEEHVGYKVSKPKTKPKTTQSKAGLQQ